MVFLSNATGSEQKQVLKYDFFAFRNTCSIEKNIVGVALGPSIKCSV